ncbi:type II secretion system F family protein [Paenibacillus larvae]|uniref:Archaeal flagella assembly protein J n=1 Tax=Paenibacillus larvae subsp. larvae TaxID=147375 RepID=A0A6C0QYT0_9BACL|nr:flagellar assembly protein FlaJ [Paenibacillus larvae]QHZ53356.1 archaeal flagella assembly protein J [Paenibacillus larvae subsp. larvae]
MFKDVLQEKNVDVYLEYFGQPKKQYRALKWMCTVLIAGLYGLAVWMMHRDMYWMGLPLVALGANKFLYLNLILKKRKQDLLKTYLFPEFLRYFISLIETSDDVRLVLEETVPYVKEPLKEELVALIEKLKETNDPSAYMQFADSIGSSEASMIMSIIHECAEFGIQKEAIHELERFIETLHENKTNELIERKIRQMDVYAYPALLLSVGFVLSFAGVLFMYYMSKIGEYM